MRRVDGDVRMTAHTKSLHSAFLDLLPFNGMDLDSMSTCDTTQ